MSRPRVLHVINGLDVGGAETSLLGLVQGLADRFEMGVVSLREGGVLESRFADAGAEVWGCGLPGRGPAGWRTLLQAVNGFQPQLLQGWLSYGNMAAGVLGLTRRDTPVIWSVRNNAQGMGEEPWLGRLCLRLGGLPIWRPAMVTYNSASGRASYAGHGYHRFPGTVIGNGVDTRRFVPSSSRRSGLRARLGCSEQTLVVGYAGRYHSIKDVPTLLRSCAALHRSLPDVRFVLAGAGLDADNPELATLTRQLDLNEAVHLLGPVGDMAEIYPGLDLLLLSSRMEGHPNVLLEAMACGVPCVSTDVGDAEALLGSRCVAPVGNVRLLAARAQAVLGAPAEHRRALGDRCRQRVVERHDLGRYASDYAQLYRSLLRTEAA